MKNIYKYITKKKYKTKNTIHFIKDAHRNSAPDACPEKSVRVFLGG